MKRPERHIHAVILDMLPSLPKPFTRQMVLDRWPQDLNRPGHAAMNEALRKLNRGHRIQIVSRGTHYEVLPLPESDESPQEKAWRQLKEGQHPLFKKQNPSPPQENKIGEDNAETQ